jgi:hypothetical protein
MIKPIPTQHTGAKSDTVHTITTHTEEEANQLFEKACNNLLNVNKWQQLAGGLSASFELTDEHGKKVHRTAQKGDYFKINIPAPGNESGHGYDWVQVEKIDKQEQPNGNQCVTMRVRPAQHPAEQQPESSHFFTSDATSSFCVEKRGLTISAEVHGRNEKPNTNTVSWFNKIRNVVIGFLAMLGMNKPQWKALVKGILEKEA